MPVSLEYYKIRPRFNSAPTTASKWSIKEFDEAGSPSVVVRRVAHPKKSTPKAVGRGSFRQSCATIVPGQFKEIFSDDRPRAEFWAEKYMVAMANFGQVRNPH